MEPQFLEENSGARKRKSSGHILCKYCIQEFSSRYSLNRHIQRIHNKNVISPCEIVVDDSSEGRESRTQITCTDCQFACFRRKTLRDHLIKAHKINMEQEHKEFNTQNEFQEWKTQEEKISASRFVSSTAPKSLHDGSKKKYLHCQRSGIYKAIEFKKQRRSPGTSKMGNCCPASMEVIFSASSGRVLVEYFKTHHGHHDTFPLESNMTDQEWGFFREATKHIESECSGSPASNSHSLDQDEANSESDDVSPHENDDSSLLNEMRAFNEMNEEDTEISMTNVKERALEKVLMLQALLEANLSDKTYAHAIKRLDIIIKECMGGIGR